MNKAFGVVLFLLFMPASLFSFGLYEKWYEKKDSTIIERLFNPEKSLEVAIINDDLVIEKLKTSNTPKEKEITKKVPTGEFGVAFFQTGEGESMTISAKMENAENISKIGVISCKENYSLEMDEEWLLSAYKKGQNSFVYNTRKDFNNLCYTPYKFNFYEGDNLVSQKEFTLYFPGDDTISVSDAKNIQKTYFYGIAKDNFRLDGNIAMTALSKNECLLVLNKSTSQYGKIHLCSDTPGTALRVTKINEDLFKISVYVNGLGGELLFSRLYDTKREIEVHNLDKKVYLSGEFVGAPDFGFDYKIDGRTLVSTLFTYDLVTKEKKINYMDISSDLSYFYRKFGEDGLYLEAPVTGKTYTFEGLPRDQIHRHFIVKDGFFAIIGDKFTITESKNLYYKELGNDLTSIQKIKLDALMLGCGAPKGTGLIIEDGVLKTTRDCNLGLDIVIIDMKENKKLHHEPYTF